MTHAVLQMLFFDTLTQIMHREIDTQRYMKHTHRDVHAHTHVHMECSIAYTAAQG